MHFRHISAKIQPKNLKQHIDWGGGRARLPLRYALEIQTSCWILHEYCFRNALNYVFLLYIISSPIMLLCWSQAKINSSYKLETNIPTQSLVQIIGTPFSQPTSPLSWTIWLNSKLVSALANLLLANC